MNTSLSEKIEALDTVIGECSATFIETGSECHKLGELIRVLKKDLNKMQDELNIEEAKVIDEGDSWGVDISEMGGEDGYIGDGVYVDD